MKTPIILIETEHLPSGYWRANINLQGQGVVHKAYAIEKTQSQSIVSVCRVARRSLGKEFIAATGNNDEDYKAFCESMEAIGELNGG